VRNPLELARGKREPGKDTDVRYITALVAVGLLGVSLESQSPASVLAPTGTLRAVFLGSNPVHGRVDPKTGVPTGPVPDLVAELARTLKVTPSILPAPDAAGVIAALKNGTADIGFLAYDETRAREVDFGPAFIVMHNSYLVRADSPLQKTADVDRAGVTVAAIKGQSQQLFVSRTLKQATIRVLDTMPPQAELESILLGKSIDAFAINRQRGLDAQSASGGKLRPLPDTFLDVDQCFVVEKGATAKLKAIEPFVSTVRQSGFINASIERAKLTGVSPARK
jgi:polar amino acid transport system substrate-binding protein